MKPDLVFAKMDPAICLAGLFRTLKKGERKKTKLDVSFAFGEATVRFVGFEALGVDDMRVLQGLVALAGPAGMNVPPDTSALVGIELRERMQLEGAASNESTLAVRTRLKTFLGEIGKESPGGKDIRLLRDSLFRLSNVTVGVTVGTQIGTAHFLSFAADEHTGELIVNLNPRLSQIVLGDNGYTRIEMSEVRALKSDIASLIHQRLCGFIAQGSSREIRLETLVAYVYSESPASGTTLRQWRARVKQALGELGALPRWQIIEARSGVFRISRKKQAAPSAKAEKRPA